MDGFPITRYQLGQLKRLAQAGIVLFIAVFIIGNLVVRFTKKRILVNPQAYVLKNGFPLFVSEKEYITLLKGYSRDIGVRVIVHTVTPGETIWSIARSYGITIDTLLAANPFMAELNLDPGRSLAVPASDGVLLAADDASDVSRMAALLGGAAASGEYRHSLFELFSLDDIRFAFFKKSKPVYINANLQQLYEERRRFQLPVLGRITSLYGGRSDPLFNEMAFHNGLDIQAPMGTPIRPIAGGIVCFAGWHEGYGLTLKVLHEGGYLSVYGHCASINAATGDQVKKDTVIGRVGSTGRSTGPHLHFMMLRHGKTINPLLFLW